MAINPLQFPGYITSPTVDFSPLGQLGDVYRQNQQYKVLDQIGRQIQGGGTVDFNKLGGQLIAAGRLPEGMSLVTLGQQMAGYGNALGALNPSGSPAPASSGVGPAGAVPVPSVGNPSPTPRAPVAPSNKWWGDDEAVRAGLYDPQPDKPSPNVTAKNPTERVADAFAVAGKATEPAGPLPAPPAIPVSSTGLQAPGSTAPIQPKVVQAQTIRNDAAPARPPNLANTAAAQADPVLQRLQGELSRVQTAGSAPMLSPNTAAMLKQRGEGLQQQIEKRLEETAKMGQSAFETAYKPLVDTIVKSKDKAQAASDSIDAVHELRGQLDAQGGILTGMGAETKLWLERAAKLAGMSDDQIRKQITNTETFKATVGKLVAGNVKAFGSGSGISEGDRKYAIQMSNGDITVDEKSMRRIFDIQERLLRKDIDQHNSTLAKVSRTDPRVSQWPTLYGVQEPPKYEPPRLEPRTPAASPQQAGAPPVPNARMGKWPDGTPGWFVPDPSRPGKFMGIR